MASSHQPATQRTVPKSRKDDDGVVVDAHELKEEDAVKVIIIGAGAAGLQCANALLEQSASHDGVVLRPNDILIFEARNRVGGRIYTTTETKFSIMKKSDSNDDNTTSFGGKGPVSIKYDHGAAWVHGTGLDWNVPLPTTVRGDTGRNRNDTPQTGIPVDNPMMTLLQKATTAEDKDKGPGVMTMSPSTSMYDYHLKPIFRYGNPWMRPNFVLHRNININNDEKKSEHEDIETTMTATAMTGSSSSTMDSRHKIAIFVGGRLIRHDSRIIREALLKHFRIFRDVSVMGNRMFANGEGMETTKISLQNAIDLVNNQETSDCDYSDKESSQTTVDGDDDVMTIQALVPFYQHLLECWYGTSASNLQLCEFIDDDDDSDDDHDDDDDDHAGDQKSNNTNTNKSYYPDQDYTEEGDFYGAHCTLKHGMESVLQPLLENEYNLRQRIRLDEPVVSITKNLPTTTASNNAEATSIEVRTSKGTIVHGQVVVVTVPIGCLLHEGIVGNIQDEGDDGCDDSHRTGIDNTRPTASTTEQQQQELVQGCDKSNRLVFEPMLSSEKRRALSSCKMGCYKKVFLTFETIFWPVNEPFIGLVRHATPQSSEQHDAPLGNYLLLDNLWACDDIPCIEAILFGQAGEWSIGKPTEVIRDAVVDFIVDAMGISSSSKNDCARPIDCHVTRWEEDEYSMGAYSSVALNASIRHVEELTRPEWDGRLILAGEATVMEFEGSVHAALFSGMKAAETVRSFLKYQP